MQTYFAGLKYSNLVYRSENYEAFLKANTKVAYSSNDMLKVNTRTNKQAQGQTKTYGYGVSLGAGVNYYLEDSKSIFTPEISLNYEGGITKPFSMSGSGALGGNERYYKSVSDLYSTTLGLKWYQQWLPQLSTTLAGGVRYNFNPEVESKANLAKRKGSEIIDLPRTYQYTQASLILNLTENFNASLNYNGTFAKEAKSHTGYLQFDFIF
ncbi:autotransporter outer membrane beta-barrel domain-containing protein [Helicobacter burdigaliensis]|uniref:autotransporter outer membrane beta-barrel domain-containing protein n=1 Tax=Helicobacter burdigaliensis TaxID=2315334 RepID=UPI000EF74274|nr:autotransporter outer membrane beta-barrel domain-containing protein [Helicobacter burdigaliensis]